MGWSKPRQKILWEKGTNKTNKDHQPHQDEKTERPSSQHRNSRSTRVSSVCPRLTSKPKKVIHYNSIKVQPAVVPGYFPSPSRVTSEQKQSQINQKLIPGPRVEGEQKIPPNQNLRNQMQEQNQAK